MTAPIARTVCQLTGERAPIEDADTATVISQIRAGIADSRIHCGPGTPKWITRMVDDAESFVDDLELEHLRTEVASPATNTMLKRQLDALFDTDLGEVQTRAEELFQENLALKAQLRGRA